METGLNSAGMQYGPNGLQPIGYRSGGHGLPCQTIGCEQPMVGTCTFVKCSLRGCGKRFCLHHRPLMLGQNAALSSNTCLECVPKIEKFD